MAKSEQMTSLGIRYPTVKVKRLARLAERNERSIAAEVRIAIDKHLGILAKDPT